VSPVADKIFNSTLVLLSSSFRAPLPPRRCHERGGGSGGGRACLRSVARDEGEASEHAERPRVARRHRFPQKSRSPRHPQEGLQARERSHVAGGQDARRGRGRAIPVTGAGEDLESGGEGGEGVWAVSCARPRPPRRPTPPRKKKRNKLTQNASGPRNGGASPHADTGADASAATPMAAAAGTYAHPATHRGGYTRTSRAVAR
jgi:hypothetical protein